MTLISSISGIRGTIGGISGDSLTPPANKLCAKTLCHYRTSQRYVMAFLERKFKCSDKYLKGLDYAFVLSLESFLRSYRPKPYQGKIGNNAVMKQFNDFEK